MGEPEAAVELVTVTAVLAGSAGGEGQGDRAVGKGEGAPRRSHGLAVGGDAGYLDAGDIGAGGSAAIRDRAELRRAGGLREDGDTVGRAAVEGSGEGESAIGADRQVVAAVILQHQVAAGKP